MIFEGLGVQMTPRQSGTLQSKTLVRATFRYRIQLSNIQLGSAFMNCLIWKLNTLNIGVQGVFLDTVNKTFEVGWYKLG